MYKIYIRGVTGKIITIDTAIIQIQLSIVFREIILPLSISLNIVPLLN